MKLVVGLGNPGKQYEGTRHNVGFAMLDNIVSDQGYRFKEEAKHHCLAAELSVGDEKILFIKPQTYYNESGQSVRSLMDFYKLSTRDILAVHDELALPFGTIRSRVGGSHAGNNGVKSLIAHIGQDFGRVRIGILNELKERMEDADFVLSKFSSSEQVLFTTVADEVKAEVLKFITDEDFGSTTKRIRK